tara:strand:- start:4164 stop:5111 length:948 start_codon:yes stop_codon:yes gene_type:complete
MLKKYIELNEKIKSEKNILQNGKNKRQETISFFFVFLSALSTMIMFYFLSGYFEEMDRILMSWNDILLNLKDLHEYSSRHEIFSAFYREDYNDIPVQFVNEIISVKESILKFLATLTGVKVLLLGGFFILRNKLNKKYGLEIEDASSAFLFLFGTIVFTIFSTLTCLNLLFNMTDSVLSNLYFISNFSYISIFFTICALIINAFFRVVSKDKNISIDKIIPKNKEISKLVKEKEDLFNAMSEDKSLLKTLVVKAGENSLSESEISVSEELFTHIKKRKESEATAKDRSDRFNSILEVELEEKINNIDNKIEIINN